MEAIYQIEKRHQNCAGYKKVTAILNNENGKNQEIPEYTFSFAFRINIKRVRRIMRKHGIKADVRQKKRSRKQEQQQYQEDNLLERKFIQIAPNLVWVSDTTELTYGRNNKVRLHVVLDLYGRYVLSYHISPTETAEAAMEVFKRATKQAGTFAPLIHTDRGAAYTSKDFNNYLTSNNSKHSLSAPGTPADNAVKGGFELSFYGGLKMYDSGGLRIDRCQTVWLPLDLNHVWMIDKAVQNRLCSRSTLEDGPQLDNGTLVVMIVDLRS